MLALALAPACSPPELELVAHGRYAGVQPVATLQVDGTVLTSVHLDAMDRQRTRFAELTPAGVAALEAAVADVADEWDPSLACSGCRQYLAYSFLDAAGDIVTTSYMIDAVPAPYRSLESFTTGVLDTLVDCEPNSLYELTAASCPATRQ